MLEELRRHREMVQERIQKSFESDGLDLNILKSQEDEIFKSQETEEQETSVTDLIKAGILEYDDSIEKAVYADTAENRKLGRVGQEYHRGKGKKEEENDMRTHKDKINLKRMWELDKKVRNGEEITEKEQKEHSKLFYMSMGLSEKEAIDKTNKNFKSKEEKNGKKYDIKNFLNENDTYEKHEVKMKYGVNLFTFADNSLMCRIDSKKEVGGLKKFLKDCGLKFDSEKLVRMKGFHGTHSYEYDLSEITGKKSPRLR